MAIIKCPAMLAALSRAYLNEPGHMPFLVNKASKDILCILQGFLEDLVFSAATWMKNKPILK